VFKRGGRLKRGNRVAEFVAASFKEDDGENGLCVVLELELAVGLDFGGDRRSGFGDAAVEEEFFDLVAGRSWDGKEVGGSFACGVVVPGSGFAGKRVAGCWGDGDVLPGDSAIDLRIQGDRKRFGRGGRGWHGETTR